MGISNLAFLISSKNQVARGAQAGAASAEVTRTHGTRDPPPQSGAGGGSEGLARLRFALHPHLRAGSSDSEPESAVQPSSSIMQLRNLTC